MIKRSLACFLFLLAWTVGYSAADPENEIKNKPCDNCILVTVTGHGVAEGHAGRYYFPTGYTVQRFWKERPVLLYYPHDRITLTRTNKEGKVERYLVDVRKREGAPERPDFTLEEGDIVYVSQPII